MEKQRAMLLLLLCSLSFVVSLGQNDDNLYWKKRRQDAFLRTKEAWRKDKFNVTNCINSSARKMLETGGMSESRRMLSTKKYDSSCEMTNPIDACWRCSRDWESHRTELAKCVLGFGKGTTGGAKGRIYEVTCHSDDDVVNPKPGTLRHAVIQNEPLWIVFKKNMTIRLKQELIMTSDKTIDGRGVQVVIENGPGITIQYVKNIIIHGIEFRNIVTAPGGVIRDSVQHYGHRNESTGNAISIYGSQYVWIDHCTFANCFHKFVEAREGATAITISNCRLSSQTEVFVLGARCTKDEDEFMQVTVAYNHFGEKLVKNMPKCSYGFCQLVNNDYRGWGEYAITGRGANSTIMCQGNRYIAPNDAKLKTITNRVGVPTFDSGTWAAEGDIKLNGAYFDGAGRERLLHNPYNLPEFRGLPGVMASVMSRYAGVLNCRPNTIC